MTTIGTSYQRGAKDIRDQRAMARRFPPTSATIASRLQMRLYDRAVTRLARYRCLRSATRVIMAAVFMLLFIPFAIAGDPAIWYKSASESPDLPTMFTNPDLWGAVRARIGVFIFAPEDIAPAQGKAESVRPALYSSGAFRKLAAWGIGTALEVPALKNWDCTGRREALRTIDEMRGVYAAGGRVDYIAMDEPMAGAKACRFNLAQVASAVQNYVTQIAASDVIRRRGSMPALVDEEPYPGFGPGVLERWVQELKGRGVTLAGLNIDVNVERVDKTPRGDAKLIGDFRQLQGFLRSEQIPFGVIFWSGYNPLRTDKEVL